MLRRVVAILAFLLVAAAPAGAATITHIEDNTTPANIPGLTGFATTGAMMNGLAVTACFTGPLGCQAVNWAATGANSGGVTGTGWSLSVDGDTFTSDWDFTMSDNLGQLVSLLLDGRLALTLFDRTFNGNTGTDGSALGLDFDTALNDGTVIDVTYINPTGIGGNLPVGDIFQQVLIEFLDLTGPRTNWSFQQDTDNDARFRKVPEPTTLLLIGLGLLLLMRIPRRR